ncbi:SDR family oxidoreductase [Rhizobium pusense]|uniref:SDR family oxidoreductase n=1 Tax=Agrobacterium pusense TaxID=648995 RepID=UPI000D19AFC6|nr:SDR family oxidoreductase [Agrobacterium pusense]MDH0910455.1 SDR family oxidoreductase [Agrobacterium pusense]MDH1098430.1 SDR family oxidoreductase [Agrobacterium pusense]MDH1114540.1 SDR family oxidoreductase [Agrobacterium pusense]MDH2195696.1 SDR family oxidoreductase [Agrobacterium pusense]
MLHAIITGGSSGIGLEVARTFVERGCSVSLIARRRVLLEKAWSDLAEGRPERHALIRIACADVTDRAGLSAAVAEAEAAFGPCDILIASAGRVDPAFFEMQSPEIFEAQVNINLVGAANAARAVYAGMKTRGRGKIVFISSGAAAIGIPGYSAYCASKTALKGFAEALRAEAQPFGVGISIAYPPDTRTPQYEEEMRHRPDEAKKITGILRPWPASKVAEKIVKAIDRGATDVHFGFALTMLALFGAFIKPVLYWRALQTGNRRETT